MKLTRYNSAGAFLKHARGPLEKEEAANSLIAGIAARVAEAPDYYGKNPIYLATIDEGGNLIAAALRTPPHNLILYSTRGADPEPLRLILEDVRAIEAQFASESPAGRLPGVVAHAATARAFAQLWSQETGGSFVLGMSQRIYELREVTPPQGVPGQLRPGRTDELDLLGRWVQGFNQDALLPASSPGEARDLAARRVDAGDLFVWEVDGQPVSTALKSRPTSHGISVGLVYTPREFRNRGYASACVAALSQQLLDAGWDFCALYTDLSNPTSNDIYQRIGYRPVCDSAEYHFAEA